MKLTGEREREEKKCQVEVRNEVAEALLGLSKAEICCDFFTVTQQTLDEVTHLREENEDLLMEILL